MVYFLTLHESARRSGGTFWHCTEDALFSVTRFILLSLFKRHGREKHGWIRGVPHIGTSPSVSASFKRETFIRRIWRTQLPRVGAFHHKPDEQHSADRSRGYMHQRIHENKRNNKVLTAEIQVLSSRSRFHFTANFHASRSCKHMPRQVGWAYTKFRIQKRLGFLADSHSGRAEETTSYAFSFAFRRQPLLLYTLGSFEAR